VGILLGVGVATFIQLSIWPEGEADALRSQLAKILQAIAAVARGHAQAVEADVEVDAPAVQSQPSNCRTNHRLLRRR
jgi:multidrug resistance protein MdtO